MDWTEFREMFILFLFGRNRIEISGTAALVAMNEILDDVLNPYNIVLLGLNNKYCLSIYFFIKQIVIPKNGKKHLNK